MKHKNKRVDSLARDWKTTHPFHYCSSSALQTILSKIPHPEWEWRKGLSSSLCCGQLCYAPCSWLQGCNLTMRWLLCWDKPNGEHYSCPLAGKGGAGSSGRFGGLEIWLPGSSGHVGEAQLACGAYELRQNPEKVFRSFSRMFLLFSYLSLSHEQNISALHCLCIWLWLLFSSRTRH